MSEDRPLEPERTDQLPSESATTHIEVTQHEGDSQLGEVALSAQHDPNRPKTADELTVARDAELARPDAELALQGIDNQIDQEEDKRNSVARSVSFTMNYDPPHPGRAPHPEDGGSDHADYAVAVAEYSGYDADEELDELFTRDDELAERIDELEALRRRVESGDATLIEKFALAEKERLKANYLARIMEATRKVHQYDTVHGIEVVGSRELLASMESLLGTVGKDGQPANSDWEHSHTGMKELSKNAMPYWYDTFVKKDGDATITVKIGAKAVPDNGAYYVPEEGDNFKGFLSERMARSVEVYVDTPDYTHEGGFIHQGQRHAEYYGFRLYDDGRIAEQAKWKKGIACDTQIPNILIGVEDVDRIQGYVDDISAAEKNET